MSAIGKTVFALILLLPFTVGSSAQQQAPPAPAQSPRQALIEMVNGGQKALVKHLTVEVQQLLSQPENKQALMGLATASSLKGEMGGDVQLFDSGPVLLSVNQPNEHTKIEVNVNNDDMSGDTDTLELSVHMFRDGQEQETEWQSFLSHLAVTMIRQQNIWRLSKIGAGVEFPVGDPEFLKKTYLKSKTTAAGVTGVGVVANTTTGETPERFDMPLNQMVMMLGFAEQSFARQHADVGFTCSLTELAEGANGFGLDQIASGSYKSYKITLTGCQGKPAGSFQIAVEPLPGKGGRAYCTDATQNLRVSDDGRASTCLSAGRPEHATFSTGEVALEPAPVDTVSKPKE